MNNKILVVGLIFLGELLAIYAEMLGARAFSAAGASFVRIFLRMFLIICLGGGFLVAGYILGYQSFKNIWIVSAASITSILIIEPTLAYFVFHQLPTTGAGIGLVLGIVGLLFSLFLK